MIKAKTLSRGKFIRRVFYLVQFLGISFAQISKVTFNCTGSTQTWVVPSGVCKVVIKAWGAGGGGGGNDAFSGNNGGGGAFATDTISVKPGDVFTIYVGCGGQSGTGCLSGAPGGAGGWGYGTGGTGGNSGTTGCSGSGGGGGGSSAVLLNGNLVVGAGGGGGSGGAGCKGNGGAGGGGGQNGQDAPSCGGAPGPGGVAGSAPNSNGTNGSGCGTQDGGGGGGGGGGISNGGTGGGGTCGGSCSSGDCGGGGGGGGNSFTISGTIIPGNGTTPGNSTDPDLCAGCARGGIGQGSAGGNGFVVIEYASGSSLSVSLNYQNSGPCKGDNNGWIKVNVSGGQPPYSFNWSNGANTDSIYNLSPGVYTVTISDASIFNCDTILSVTIQEPPAITLTTVSLQNVKCNGESTGSVHIGASGGGGDFQYSWSNGVNLPINDNIPAGVYTLTVSDQYGCQVTTSVTITEPPPIVATITSDSVNCYGTSTGAITLATNGGTPGYSFTWSNGSTTQNISNIPAGTYYVTIKDNNNCTLVVSTVVYEPSSLTVSINSVQNPSCYGGEDGAIWASASGGTYPYSFSWSNGQTTSDISNLSSGTYNLTVSDYHQCYITTSVLIQDPPPLLISLVSIQHVSCKNGSDGYIEVAGNGGTPPYTYSWSNNQNSQIISNLSAGAYTVTITDSKGCINVKTYTITEPPQLIASISQYNDATCAGSCNGSASGTASGGTFPYSFFWSNGTQGMNAFNLCAGVYTLSVYDSKGCLDIINVTINEPQALNLTIISTSNPTCAGYCDGSAQITVSGGTPPYSFNWSNGESGALATGLCAGNNGVVITDANGCVFSSIITLGQPSAMALFMPPNTTICPGQPTSLQVTVIGGTPPYQFNWNTGAQTPSINVAPTSPSCFYITVYDQNNCGPLVDSVCLYIYPPVNVSVYPNKKSICKGDTVFATANGWGGLPPYQYYWSSGSSSQNVTLIPNTYPDTTYYYVTVKDACQQTATEYIEISYYPQPIPLFSVNPQKGCLPLNVSFTNNSTNAFSCVWKIDSNTMFGCSDFSHTFYSPGNHQVQLYIISDKGCRADTPYTIFVSAHSNPIADFYYSPQITDILTPFYVFYDKSISTDPIISWNWEGTNPSDSFQFSDSGSVIQVNFPPEPSSYIIKLVIETNAGCKDSIEKEIYLENTYSLWVPNTFTPNEDGINDTFIVQGSGINWEASNLLIYDRWGRQIWSGPLKDGWPGVSKNGKPSQEGTYIFVITGEFTDKDKTKFLKKGHVNLLR